MRQIASALQVPYSYLYNGPIVSPTEVMYVLFDMEHNFKLQLSMDEYGEVFLKFDDAALKSRIKKWYYKYDALRNGKLAKEDYEGWKINVLSQEATPENAVLKEGNSNR